MVGHASSHTPSACGDGASTVSNPNLNAETGYTGPAPRTEDIRSFMTHFWQDLSQNNRCGQCHGVDQAPLFVDQSDVNRAYSVAIKYVSLIDPAGSKIVEKAATGHHCWLGTNNGAACADNIERKIMSIEYLYNKLIFNIKKGGYDRKYLTSATNNLSNSYLWFGKNTTNNQLKRLYFKKSFISHKTSWKLLRYLLYSVIG